MTCHPSSGRGPSPSSLPASASFGLLASGKRAPVTLDYDTARLHLRDLDRLAPSIFDEQAAVLVLGDHRDRLALLHRHRTSMPGASGPVKSLIFWSAMAFWSAAASGYTSTLSIALIGTSTIRTSAQHSPGVSWRTAKLSVNRTLPKWTRVASWSWIPMI